MLSKSIQTLSLIALGSLMSLPLSASAAGCSSASYYGMGDGFHGRTTANGERFDAHGRTAAHRWLPFGTLVRVTNNANGRSVVVRISDRGPFVGGRDLDLSYGAFTQIASASQGVASVCYARI